MALEMDLSVVHASVGLRLADLAEADDFNFVHDITGIRDYPNRETGELEHNFVPRYSLRRGEQPDRR